jgi:hypothetical protein
MGDLSGTCSTMEPVRQSAAVIPGGEWVQTE